MSSESEQQILWELRAIKWWLKALLNQEGKNMDELQQLKDQAAQTESTDQAAVGLLTGLAAKIDSMKGDPAALTALATDLRTQSTALATAITTYTPAAGGGTPPTPPPPPAASKR